MAFEYIEYRQEERLAYITLNRPDKRNALSDKVVTELKTAFTLAEEDEGVKVIILNANGKVFSAGADLQYLQGLQTNTYEENLADSTHLMELFRHIYLHPKVVIAQVEGHAIAGGCGLATVCDFTFSVPEAKFGYTEVKIGFIPAIVMIFLVRKIGEANAKELLLTGKLIDAPEAVGKGLINKTIEANKIQEEVKAFALNLCGQASGESLKLTKQMLAKVQEMSLDDSLRYASEMNAQARAGEDCKKGISAFLNKEKLEW